MRHESAPMQATSGPAFADAVATPGWAQLALISGLMLGGVIGTYSVPYQIGAFTTGLGFDAARAGVLATVHILGLGVTALILAMRIDSLSWRRLAVAGAGLALIGQLASALLASFEALLAARTLAGVGSGCLLALANAVIAATTQPEKNYGRIYAMMAATVAVILVVLPRILDVSAPAPLFIAHAVLFLGLMPLACWIPSGGRAQKRVDSAGSMLRLQVLMLFLAMTLLFVSAGGAYSFSARAAGLLKISDESVGAFLALSTLAGLIGAMIAGRVGLRWGRRVPLALSGLITGIAALTIVLAANAALFFAGIVLYGAGSLFTMSYVQGLAVALDKTGRTAVAAGGYLLIAYAFGPAVFGALVQSLSAALGWLALLACIVAALTMVLIAPVETTRHR